MKALIATAVIAGINVWLGYPFPMWLAFIPIAFLLIKPLFIIVGCAILIAGALFVSAIYGEGSVSSTIDAMKAGVKEELHAIKIGK